jgi:hypothetical protein
MHLVENIGEPPHILVTKAHASHSPLVLQDCCGYDIAMALELHAHSLQQAIKRLGNGRASCD